jgi:RNA polymerase sigma factor (sigma-70 family)
MATAQLGTLLQHIQQLAVGCDREQRTDRQLLDDFIARREATAFTALVSRHGPMVLRVCRRVLHHEQDAEDAFQAAFLVLAGHARSIRQRDTLAGWLYGVAYRTALNARRRAARRRKYEAARGLETAPQHETTWYDVQTVLDDEIQRLRPCFREAFVLCVLEGKAGSEVAAALGCKEGTVKSRVHRARQLLQQQLSRRGIQLAAVLAALAVGEGATQATVPAALAQATIRNGLLVAVGQSATAAIPTQVAGLAATVTRTLFLTRAKIAIALFCAAAFLTAVGAWTHQALGARENPPPAAQPTPPAKAANSEAADTIEVSGRVLDPSSRPVRQAQLVAVRKVKSDPGRMKIACAGRSTTDRDGHFTLKLARKEVQPSSGVNLVATAEGFGLAWIELTGPVAGDLTLRLVKDVPIRGRLISTEGKPVTGVTVAVLGVMEFEKLDDFLRASQREMRHLDEGTGARSLTLPATPILQVTPSDKDGWFTIRGVGAERVAGLEVHGAGIAQSNLVVVTRPGLDTKARTPGQSRGTEGRSMPSLFGPSFEHVVEPTRLIEGTVREAGTGKPVIGATAQTLGVVAVTDAQGHFTLRGMRKAAQYLLDVRAPANSPFISRWVRVPGAPGLEPMKADVEMIHGVVIAGRVRDRATGKGVDSLVHFSPLPGNPFAQNLADLNLNAFTAADGRFRLVTIPGPGILMGQVVGITFKIEGVPIYPYKPAEIDPADRSRVKVVEDLKPYRSIVTAGGMEMFDNINACKVLDLKEGGSPLTCDLVFDPGKTLTVHVQDAEGKPLTGALAAGVSAQALRAVPLKTATCPVYALDPEKPRQMVFLHTQRKLAGVVTVRGDESGPVTVRLGPTGTLTGRALDRDGQPVGGAEVYVGYEGLEGQQLNRMLGRWGRQPETDKDGRFRVEGIVPGLQVDSLRFLKGRQVLVLEGKREIKRLEAGKTLDLGDVRIKPRRP